MMEGAWLPDSLLGGQPPDNQNTHLDLQEQEINVYGVKPLRLEVTTTSLL